MSKLVVRVGLRHENYPSLYKLDKWCITDKVDINIVYGVPKMFNINFVTCEAWVVTSLRDLKSIKSTSFPAVVHEAVDKMTVGVIKDTFMINLYITQESKAKSHTIYEVKNINQKKKIILNNFQEVDLSGLFAEIKSQKKKTKQQIKERSAKYKRRIACKKAPKVMSLVPSPIIVEKTSKENVLGRIHRSLTGSAFQKIPMTFSIRKVLGSMSVFTQRSLLIDDPGSCFILNMMKIDICSNVIADSLTTILSSWLNILSHSVFKDVVI